MGKKRKKTLGGLEQAQFQSICTRQIQGWNLSGSSSPAGAIRNVV